MGNLTGFLDLTDTRRLVLRIAGLTASVAAGAPAGADAAHCSRDDAALLAACRKFGEIEREKLLLLDGPRRTRDDG